jgi:hypothetical protein
MSFLSFMMILTSSPGLKGKAESFATAEGISEKGKISLPGM